MSKSKQDTQQLDTSVITELESDIKSYDRSLKRRPNDDNLYHAKGSALIKLGDATKDNTYYNKALESYAKAISLKPLAMYYIDRSKLYIKLDRSDLAADDIAKAQLGASGDKVFDMYTKNTMQDVLKLDSVQDQINKLIKEKKLPKELENVFANMIGVVNGISLRVSEHDNRLNNHDDELASQAKELASLKAELANMQKQYSAAPDLLSVIDSLKTEVKTLEQKVASHDKSITAINKQMSKLCTKEEFSALSKKVDKIEIQGELFAGKIKIIEGKQQDQEVALIQIDEALYKSNVYNRQTIKDSFDRLQKEDIHGFEYANHFYWSLSNYLLAYRAISTGMIPGIREQNQLERFWNDWGSKIIKATSSIPMIGGILTIIENGIISLNNSYQGIKFELKKQKINELITKFVLEEDLSLAVASASIKLASIKKAEIASEVQKQNAPKQPTSNIVKKTIDAVDKKVQAFNDTIDSLMINFAGIDKVVKTPAMNLAIKDTVLFINHVVTAKEQIKVSEDTISTLDSQIVRIFVDEVGNTNDAVRKVITRTYNAVEKTAKESQCIIAIMSDVEYDNALLNHQELLKHSIERFGFNKALDLSEKLSEQLMSEVIVSNDSELLLAGMMSLDY